MKFIKKLSEIVQIRLALGPCSSQVATPALARDADLLVALRPEPGDAAQHLRVSGVHIEIVFELAAFQSVGQ